jgi:hypothetical protein
MDSLNQYSINSGYKSYPVFMTLNFHKNIKEISALLGISINLYIKLFKKYKDELENK